MAIVILVLIGLASLVVGVIVDNLIWVYAAAALSALALVFLAFGAWRRRRATAKAQREDAAIEDADDPASDHAANDDGELDEIAQIGTEADSPSPWGGSGDEVIVQVISGRRRFHLPGCPLTADASADDVTLAEARGEGFSPCSRCIPAESLV